MKENKKNETEVMVFQPQSEEVVIPLEQAVAVAEHNIEVFKKIKQVVLKATYISDWVKMGKTYQITGGGAERIAGLIGVSWSNVTQTKTYSEDEAGKYYLYEYRGIFSFGNRQIEAVGTCSQRDKFFSMKNGKPLPASEVDETNIMKAAYTNMVMNGVTRILGLRGITEEDLKSAGFNITEIAEVNFVESGEDSESVTKKRKLIWDYLSKNYANPKAELSRLTTWTNKNGETVSGQSDINLLSQKQIEILYGKLKDKIIEFQKKDKAEEQMIAEQLASVKITETQKKWLEELARKQNLDITGFLYQFGITKPVSEMTQKDYSQIYEAATKKGGIK